MDDVHETLRNAWPGLADWERAVVGSFRQPPGWGTRLLSAFRPFIMRNLSQSAYILVSLNSFHAFSRNSSFTRYSQAHTAIPLAASIMP